MKNETKLDEKNIMLYSTIDEIIDTSYDDLVTDYLLKHNVIALPCKKGEKIFEIAKDCFRGSHYKEYDFCLCEREPKGDLFEVDWDKDCVYEILEMPFSYNMITDMDEMIFLTRYEAEKALKEMYKNE